MNKKGVEEVQLLLIAYLIINIIILISLFYIAERELTGPGAIKQFLARDFSLLLNTIYNSNGDLEINYNIKYPYETKFSKGITSIKTTKPLEKPDSYYYTVNSYYTTLNTETKNYEIINNEIQVCSFIFKKSDEEVSINKGEICLKQ